MSQLAIYKITCIPTGKMYIGKDTRYPKRFVEHRSALRGNKHFNKYLQYAWNKHGENAFTYELIQFAENKEQLSLLELYWIELYNSFNNKIGFNQAIGLGSYGIIRSEETRRKIAKALTGKKLGRTQVENAARSRWKKVYQYDKQCNLIATHSSVKACAAAVGMPRAGITHNCNGLCKTAHGYVFSYKPLTEIILPEPNTAPQNCKKIMRVSDGKIYKSIGLAIEDNNLSRKKIEGKLKKGDYKLIECGEFK